MIYIYKLSSLHLVWMRLKTETDLECGSKFLQTMYPAHLKLISIDIDMQVMHICDFEGKNDIGHS